MKKYKAFTLVELLVVISIIALLISILLPSFRTARIAAKVVASQSRFVTIETGIEMFRTERALGSVLPPSTTDFTVNNKKIIELRSVPGIPSTSSTPIGTWVQSSGANLLYLALSGYDGEGTTGFKKLKYRENDQRTINWGISKPGVHYPKNLPRYGPFVEGSKMTKTWSVPNENNLRIWRIWRTYEDLFGNPILYYKARKSARKAITKQGSWIGVYDYEDNSIITNGYQSGDGTVRAWDTKYDDDWPKPEDINYYENFGSPFNHDKQEFKRFDQTIIDSQLRNPGKSRPYNQSNFILLTAGPDNQYGTPDDLTNFTERN